MVTGGDDLTEEFEPLFDYGRVQPLHVISLDDDESDASPTVLPKRAKISTSPLGRSVENNLKDKQVVDIEEDEEDWLPPPPKLPVDTKSMRGEDSTLKELRLKKEELASFALSAKNLLRAVEECAKVDVKTTAQDSLEPDLDDQTPIPTEARAKIVISVQGKNGPKQFRLFMDDKFERLFKMYADKYELNPQSLVFSFDGDKISPGDTPVGLGMEDNDMIEVNIKSS